MRVTIGKKLTIGFGLGLIVLIIIGTVSYLGTKNIMKNVFWTEHTYGVLGEIAHIVSDLKDAETGQRGFLITGEERYLEPYSRAVADYKKQIDHVQELTIDNPIQQKRVEKLSLLVEAKFEELQETINLRKNQGFKAALAVVLTDSGKIIMDDIRAVVDEMTSEEMTLLEVRSQDQKTSAITTKTTIVIGTIIAFVLMALAGFFITRMITKSLKFIIGKVTEIADSAGDLTVAIPVKTNDEIGDLGAAFNRMIEGLRVLISQVAGIAESVSVSSQELSSSAEEMNATTEEISSTVQQIAKGTETQAQKVDETQKTMDQMSTSVEQVTKSAQDAAEQAVSAAETARSGGDAAINAQTKTVQVSNVIINSSDTIARLGERSEQIGSIVNVITNLADQTNLLALNAAIEAARAGEYGRGFAVVAEEVRKLAEGSAKAADEIGKLITEVQKETVLAVDNMKNVSVEALSLKDFTEKGSENFTEIIKNTESVAAMIEEVSAASEEQAAGSVQVTRSVADIASVAEETASATEEASASTEEMTASMEEMAASAQELADMGMRLREMVGNFKLSKSSSDNSVVSDKSKKADGGKNARNG